jgi:hypothetical protein
MNTAGIECLVQYGTLENNGHVWNVIRIDGEYYNIDVTPARVSADRNTYIDYSFFNVTDQDIRKTHVIEPIILTNSTVQVSYDVPPCTAHSQTFDTLFSVKVEGNVFNQGDFTRKIKKLHAYNLSSVYFLFPEGTSQQTVKNFFDTHGYKMNNLVSGYFHMDNSYSYRAEIGKAFIRLDRI